MTMSATKRSRQKVRGRECVHEYGAGAADGLAFDVSQTIKRQPARDYVKTEEDVALTACVRRWDDCAPVMKPWLCSNVTFNHAARSLGATPVYVNARVNRFRQWVRVLDPGEDVQARIRMDVRR